MCVDNTIRVVLTQDGSGAFAPIPGVEMPEPWKVTTAAVWLTLFAHVWTIISCGLDTDGSGLCSNTRR